MTERDPPRKRLVVVGLGMVGISFIEKILKYDTKEREYDITVLGEEPYLAYNRVGLTSFFNHREIPNLYLNPQEWYETTAKKGLACHISTKVVDIDTDSKTVHCETGHSVPYDILVLATGSNAVLPRRTPGHDANGVFVYRTIDDLVRLIAFAKDKGETDGVVVGGGLLGLEAANAMMDLEVYRKVRLVERNKWVLSRQLDADAGDMVVEQIRQLGLDVMLSKRVQRIQVDASNNVQGVVFEDGEELSCSTVCFAIGISPRDELARNAGIDCAEFGGIAVDDSLCTSAPGVYAVGECASWRKTTYGLIAPGVEMADVLAFNLTQAALHAPRVFKRPDVSTKLKLLGVDVASFGDFFADRDGPKYLPPKYIRDIKAAKGDGAALTAADKQAKMLTYKDPFQNVYKKYIFTADGKYLLGGMMIGDTSDYIKVVPLVKNMKELDVSPAEFIIGNKKGDDENGDDLDDDTQICSCHNVTKGDVVQQVKSGECKDIASVKACTKAGTGCGGCMPLVTRIFNKTLTSMGKEVTNYLCEHFNYSRTDLFNIIMVKKHKTFSQVFADAGNKGSTATTSHSVGCELCKPAVASIFASLWNKHVLSASNRGLQDTNDRYLGNIQRDGTYSVVPRIPGGEITPAKLLAIGRVAEAYGLYTKITGGQRIDLFGARKQDLPAIWAALGAAGLESGHAYAKSLRTVKSCVGSTWCRFGIGDSVGLAVRLEERYKSIRAPHKIKGGVSGCVRECAEAQSKDFGLIATEKGFNVFVGGNGGANPKHAILLAKDVPPADVVALLDRYLMLYIRTADKLQRTAPWLEALPGGINYLQDVIVRDKLGICASLEAQMKELVDSYFDEWADAIADPAIAARFTQFDNAPEAALPSMEQQSDRSQSHPVHWTTEPAAEDFKALGTQSGKENGDATWSSTAWEPVISASHFDGADELPNGISATIKRGDTQLAVWRVRGRYYATQQMCPHKRAFILSDGLIGQSSSTGTVSVADESGAAPAPWVSCPHHKRNFDLSSGSCRNDSSLSIATFAVEERADGQVHLLLPPVEELDARLGTSTWRVKKGESGEEPLAALDRKYKLVGRRGRRPGSAVAPMAAPTPLITAGGGGGCGAAPDW
ncbi:nitrite reductase [Cordyceps fumosorosea ARSEF 2679]|uniref:Nitrite reductase [NAD(P)H] n=1 Tax=Cordyceps fumosorosea (strain ARSEF 2679) TaxID=1081104 RepID=A0A167SCJ1_CORFA|nr:nitrite reductase [Cordyceps fumosorosea ARSEF 2679]OAA59489.1 nitrite reductase [Cordyceps fumosorosea ARSEF 2679]